MTRQYTTEHRTTTYVSGPLLIAEHAEHVAYDELVEVVTPSGERRRGQVLEIEGDRMVVQVLGGTRGLDVSSTTVLARARSAELAVGRDLVGRVLDGMGRPIDGGPHEVTIVESHSPDAPFIFESLKNYFQKEGLRVFSAIHPLFTSIIRSFGR